MAIISLFFYDVVIFLQIFQIVEEIFEDFFAVEIFFFQGDIDDGCQNREVIAVLNVKFKMFDPVGAVVEVFHEPTGIQVRVPQPTVNRNPFVI